jgi:AcrR family transcriptional regulator
MARPRQVSDEDILEAARETFLTEGPNASVTRIAKRIGVSQAALFKRFGSKTELMMAALAPPMPVALLAMIDEGPDERPIEVQLYEVARRLQQHMRMLIPHMWILKSSGVTFDQITDHFNNAPPPVHIRRGLTKWFERAQATGRIRALDPEATSYMLMGGIHARTMICRFEGQMPPEETDDEWLGHVVETLWRGIRADEVPE